MISNTAQFVTIGVAGETFAAPVEKVQEILQMRPIARLPQAAAGLLGMIDVRSQTVPVIDLRTVLGFPPAEDTDSTRIVVLSFEQDGRQLNAGLRTDKVVEVTILDEPELEPPPRIGGHKASPAIAGIGRRNGTFVTVLDLDRILSAADIKDLAVAA